MNKSFTDLEEQQARAVAIAIMERAMQAGCPFEVMLRAAELLADALQVSHAIHDVAKKNSVNV